MRAALGREDGRDGLAQGCVRAEAVDGFGAESDELPLAQQRRRVGDALGAGQDAGQAPPLQMKGGLAQPGFS